MYILEASSNCSTKRLTQDETFPSPGALSLNEPTP
jgi:hypothetical protein